jgi:hypothetical protein
MNKSKHTKSLQAPWLTLLGAFTLIALPSCSTPQSTREELPQTIGSTTPIELIPPHLATGGGSLTSGNSGKSCVVVNSNRLTTLRVDWVRQKPDQASSITSRTDVPPGQSVVIGYSKMNGASCTYEITGWAKTRPLDAVKKEKAHVAPRALISSNNE